jgi:tRNA/rRNA methyltransferase
MKRKADLSRIAVVLSRPSHPGNVGACARAMKTMGLTDLVLVAPRRVAHAQARALAAGAVDVLESARVVRTLPEALAERVLSVGFSARGRDLAHRARDWRELAPEVLDAARCGPVALVFGNETFGLTNGELLACQRHATIAANPDYPSLNLAAAVQVACYELAAAARAFSPVQGAKRKPATGSQLEALHAHVRQALVASGFLDPANPRRFEERLRRLVARADLEREEVALLRGMIASLESPRKRSR